MQKRYLWVFTGSEKYVPNNKFIYFINTLKNQNKTIHQIRVDEGGELSRSTYFIKILLDNNINMKLQGI